MGYIIMHSGTHVKIVTVNGDVYVERHFLECISEIEIISSYHPELVNIYHIYYRYYQPQLVIYSLHPSYHLNCIKILVNHCVGSIFWMTWKFDRRLMLKLRN